MKDASFVEAVRTVYRHFPFLQAKLRLRLKDVRSTSDIAELPFVTREDILEYSRHYEEFLPDFDGCYIERTSGTTGPPKTVLWSYEEFETEARNIHNVWKLLGIAGKGSRFAVSLGVPGVGYQLVLHSLSYSHTDTLPLPLIPQSDILPLIPQSDILGSHIEQLVSFLPTVMVTAPILMIRYFQVAKRMGVSLKKIRLKKLILTGEPLPQGTRRLIARLWNISDGDICDGYCTTEASVIGHEYPRHSGVLVSKDSYIMEIVDPVTDQNTDGLGEIIVTKANRSSFPLVRYRTGDVGRLAGETVVNGQEFYVLTDIKGRLNDSIRLHHCTIYKGEFEQMLLSIDSEVSDYVIHLFEEAEKKKLVVYVESSTSETRRLSQTLQEAIMGTHEGLEAMVKAGMVDIPEVIYVPMGTIARKARKEWLVYAKPE